MRIAFISYEYPPDTAFGGIATYVHQVANLLSQRGHDVFVFCGSLNQSETQKLSDNLTLVRVKANADNFRNLVVESFSLIHEQNAFDIIESPEYKADGYYIKLKFPELPLVVKLHTATYLANSYNNYAFVGYTGMKNMGIFIQTFCRILKYRLKYLSAYKNDPEYQITRLADEIQAPSVSIGNIARRDWFLKDKKIEHVPYPFVPSPSFLSVEYNLSAPYVTFIGSYQVRKGILKIMKVIPDIIRKHPETKFRFIGRDMIMPRMNLMVSEYIKLKLGRYADCVEFCSVKNEDIPSLLAQTAVAVFPSYWENFPNVCLESMSAGIPVVGSKWGGMSDMLNDPNTGTLVNPYFSSSLRNGILKYLDNKELGRLHGSNERRRVLETYNNQIIGNLIEKRFQSVILQVSEKALSK